MPQKNRNYSLLKLGKVIFGCFQQCLAWCFYRNVIKLSALFWCAVASGNWNCVNNSYDRCQAVECQCWKLHSEVLLHLIERFFFPNRAYLHCYGNFVPHQKKKYEYYCLDSIMRGKQHFSSNWPLRKSHTWDNSYMFEWRNTLYEINNFSMK